MLTAPGPPAAAPGPATLSKRERGVDLQRNRMLSYLPL